MLGFLIGLTVGGIFGVIIMALIQFASAVDKSMENHEDLTTG